MRKFYCIYFSISKVFQPLNLAFYPFCAKMADIQKKEDKPLLTLRCSPSGTRTRI